MKWLVSAVVLAAAAATLSPAAGSGTRPPTAAERAEWLRARKALTAKVPGGVTRLPETADYYAELLPAGNLDGTGGTDLVDVRGHLQYDDTTESMVETVTLEAYRGNDGGLLWTRTLPPAGMVHTVPAKVGATGGDGLLVMSFNDQYQFTDAGGGVAGSVTITAIAGAGVPLWSQTFGRGWVESMPGWADQWTSVAGLFDAVAGAATDLVLTTQTSTAVYDPTYQAAAAAGVLLLDGATGTVRPLGVPVASEGSWLDATAVGDLDGDKLDDVAVQVDDGEEMQGWSSADGEVLWTLRDYVPGVDFSFAYARGLPDVTGDGAADVAVEADSWTITPGSGEPRRSSTVVLVDGKRGTVRWRKSGDALLVLGNADGKPGAEVALRTPVEGKRWGLSVAAYTGAGKRLWATTRAFSLGKKDDADSSGLYVLGDTGTDGVTELGYEVSIRSGKKLRSDYGTIDGRTGRVRKDPRADMRSASGALDGRGADTYVAGGSASTLRIEAYRGDGASRLWTTEVAMPVRMFFGSFGASVDGDKCSDLVSGAWGAMNTYTDVVFSGGTGTVRWMLSRTDGDAAVVTVPKPRSHKVFRKGC